MNISSNHRIISNTNRLFLSKINVVKITGNAFSAIPTPLSNKSINKEKNYEISRTLCGTGELLSTVSNNII
jgi:hypothetical protein